MCVYLQCTYIYNCHLPYLEYNTKTLYCMNKTKVPVITVKKFKVFKVIIYKSKRDLNVIKKMYYEIDNE